MNELDAWVAAVAEDLGLTATDVQTKRVLDVARDVAHHVWAHFGVRTHRHKLVYYYDEPCGAPGAYPGRGAPEWELFDLEADPNELISVYGAAAYADVVTDLKAELRRLQTELGDTECAPAPG